MFSKKNTTFSYSHANTSGQLLIRAPHSTEECSLCSIFFPSTLFPMKNSTNKILVRAGFGDSNLQTFGSLKEVREVLQICTDGGQLFSHAFFVNVGRIRILGS